MYKTFLYTDQCRTKLANIKKQHNLNESVSELLYYSKKLVQASELKTLKVKLRFITIIA